MVTDERYTDLPVAPNIANNDVMAMVDVTGNVSYQFTFEQLITFLSANLSIGIALTYGTTLPANTVGNNGDVFIKTDTQQFAQKILGVWTVFYTVSATTTDGTVLFGSGVPSGSTGNNNDTFVDVTTGKFYKKASGAWTMQFTMANGPAGPRGNSILNGSVNPLNTDGINGDFFLNTTTLTLFGPKASGVWPGSGQSVKPGVPNTILNGTGNPSNGTGNDGDFYLNTSNYLLFGPKASGVWPAGVSLIPGFTISYEIDFPAGSSTDLDYSSPTFPDVTASGLQIYAEQYYTNTTIDATGANIFIPYSLQVFKISATNHFLFRKSDPGDHIKITIKP